MTESKEIEELKLELLECDKKILDLREAKRRIRKHIKAVKTVELMELRRSKEREKKQAAIREALRNDSTLNVLRLRD